MSTEVVAPKASLTYKDAGVDYDILDPFKEECRRVAKETKANAARLGFFEAEDTRGESAFLMRMIKHHNEAPYIGHVEEGLGTKNLVADAVRKLTGKTHYDAIAQCNVAMVVNDLASLGVSPVSFALHVASGDNEWFKDQERVHDLVEGTGQACNLARCVWGGGETPTLKGIIVPGTVLLSGSAWGVPITRHRIDPMRIRGGDIIIFLTSSGIHANGLTLARKIAGNLPEGYATRLSDGTSYGEALLQRTHIYCDFVEDCLAHKVDVHYAINITGHGYRKLMRAPQSFAYIVDELPPQLPIFDFLQEHGPMLDGEAYGNLNMGAGFALIVPPEDVETVLELGKEYHAQGRYQAMEAGWVEESGVRRVEIRPKNLIYEAGTLKVR